ncbi:MAG: hypothetical protein QGF46_06220, partial [Planctomycetota bacterium]|nr:hypothetical protein [Planctomycetota bacterium]
MRGSGDVQTKDNILTTRLVLDGDSPRSKLQFSYLRQILPNLNAGVEYMPSSDRYSPVINWRFMNADGWLPALAVGSSSAWPSSKVSGNAYFLTAANSLGNGFSAYVSAAFAPDGDIWYMPAGLNYKLNEDWSARLMYDGDNLHPLVSYTFLDLRTSFIMLDGDT